MAAKNSKVAAPRLSPVTLEDIRDDPAPDFRRGERYDGVRYSRAA
ncbi:MAG TPA: pentapeptide repeat-containing protein, partial [Arthrobacter sp.]|nr:pentapeptide repeat-containing protein [Arthrobacter sp.]